MKWIAVVVFVVVTGAIAVAQTGGTLAGTATMAGDPVPGATIQAKEMSTGKVFAAATTKTGHFRIADLPAGRYEISVPQIGVGPQRYVQADVAIQAGQTRTLDIALVANNQGIVGDDQGYFPLYAKYANITGRAPRASEGRPDFSGTWLANVDPNPEPASMLPWAVAEWNRRRDSNFEGIRLVDGTRTRS